MLSLGALEAADGLHQGTTGTHPVSRMPIVNVTGEETKWTVVAVTAPIQERAYETTTVPALEYLIRG